MNGKLIEAYPAQMIMTITLFVIDTNFKSYYWPAYSACTAVAKKEY